MGEIRSLPDLFFRRAKEFAAEPRFLVHRGGSWTHVPWPEHERAVVETAAGWIASGVAPGTKVALLCGTRPEWIETDFGILSAGAITIPIYPSNLADECGYILWNSESRWVVVENPSQLVKIRKVMREGFELDGLKVTIPLDGIVMIEGEPDGADVMMLAALRAKGAGTLPAARQEIEARTARIGRDDVATIVYTSGTTGPPKGVVQTHGNHLAAVEGVVSSAPSKPGEVDFLYLPLAHSFARALEYVSTWAGTTTAFARKIETIPDDLLATRPHYVPSVPRIFEKLYARVQSMAESSGGIQKMIFDWAVSVGRQRSAAIQKGQTAGLLVELQAMVADQLVFSKIRERLGGRVKFMMSGGAPLAREIQEFFHAAGVLVLEGYGLTETTPTLTANRPDDYRFGTVGKALPGVTLEIAADGEILAKGANVTKEYFKRPEATAEAWDKDGWFHTGDIGEISPDGFLRITDRKKDLIKTSGGKYVAPQNVENLLKTQPHVSQAVLIGDNRKYCAALVTIDREEVERWAKGHGITTAAADLWKDPAVQKLLESEVAAVNQHLASYESIKTFRIVPHEFSQETGELTPTLKVKRKVVNQKYADVIESMYPS